MLSDRYQSDPDHTAGTDRAASAEATVVSSAGSRDELLTVPEVSQMTRVPESTLRRWRSRGYGPASFTLGRRVVYRRGAVQDFIEAQEIAAFAG